MTSIVTNSAAIAALQTLRSIGSDLDDTQNRISSGQRVSEAADNAAYWSISTTMRSDKKAISAVSDALGLSSAMLDTAYTATSAIVDVLDEVKAKLVAAAEPGVDKDKIQKEIDQLNDQAETIVKSASFNGQNWLWDTTGLLPLEKKPVSLITSFERSDAGVSLDTVDIDIFGTTMIDSIGGGLLQKEAFTGQLEGFDPTVLHTDHPVGAQSRYIDGPISFAAGSSLSFDLVVDRSADALFGQNTSITITRADVDTVLGAGAAGVVATPGDLANVLNYAFSQSGAKAHATYVDPYDPVYHPSHFPGSYTISSLETTGLNGSSIEIENPGSTGVTGFADLHLGDPFAEYENTFPTATITFEDFSLSTGQRLQFDYKLGNGPMETAVIDRETIDNALGTSIGNVATAEDLAEVILYATQGKGLDVTVSGSELTLSADKSYFAGYGGKAAGVQVGNIGPGTEGWWLKFDLDEIDLNSWQYSVDDYITGVDYMLERSIKSAASLGALQSHVDTQTDFAQDLMDSLDKGIGRLVDADMDQESTRLKALQTQQQLAIQSLSIANSNSQNLMQLFN